MATAILSAPPPPLSSHQISFFQRSYSTSFGSITFFKFPVKPTIPLSTAASSSTSSTVEDETSASSNDIPVQSESSTLAVVEPSFRGCKACGREELERGCNGEGRIQGGIATVPGFGWWPIKAYRPCPAFVASGGRYTRRGQSMDEVASGRGGRGGPLGTSDEADESRRGSIPSLNSVYLNSRKSKVQGGLRDNQCRLQRGIRANATFLNSEKPDLVQPLAMGPFCHFFL